LDTFRRARLPQKRSLATPILAEARSSTPAHPGRVKFAAVEHRAGTMVNCIVCRRQGMNKAYRTILCPGGVCHPIETGLVFACPSQALHKVRRPPHLEFISPINFFGVTIEIVTSSICGFIARNSVKVLMIIFTAYDGRANLVAASFLLFEIENAYSKASATRVASGRSQRACISRKRNYYSRGSPRPRRTSIWVME
jgi:hypothetical protein